ncbi:MAG TPA: hypothetical protein VF502_16670 [Stellaceae bacterium]
MAPPDVPPELAPPAEPVALGEELLPEELPGPQSLIAVVPLLPLALEPFEAELLLEPGLLVEPAPPALGLLVPELEPMLFEAELPPGPQSVLLDDMPPDVEPLVPAVVPDLPLLVPAPVVVLVCAIAAVPRVNAMIDAAVRRRRFIRCPPLNEAPRQAESPRGRCSR